MNRGQAVALGGSLLVVLVGFLVARSLVPAPAGSGSESAGIDAVLGKWRPSSTKSCADGRLLTIEKDRLIATFNDKDHVYDFYDVQIEQTEKGPALHLHIKTEPKNVNFYVHLDVREDVLKFVSSEWSEESEQAYGQRLDDAGLRNNLKNWQALNPLRRCP